MLSQTTANDALFAILLAAFLLDAAGGDPAWLYRRIPHPVALLGRAIEAAEARLNRPGPRRAERLFRGLLFALTVVALAGALGWAVESFCNGFTGGWIVEAVLASTLIAFRGLYDGVRAVARGLRLSLEEGRLAVSHLVGRDPGSLDEAGVARAAAESLAENFSDGVVAPILWFAVLGLPGLCAYKALNTLDSMIGQRSERYEAFGKAAARLDDAANWVPARLAGLLLAAAAALLPGASAAGAWQAMWRDAARHRSPNAGWQEAPLAGALGLALAGPRRYVHGPVDDHWMGDGRAALTPADLDAALRLYLTANALLAGLLVAAWLAV
jgi:adenosylcobinamide-phosphate synthase